MKVINGIKGFVKKHKVLTVFLILVLALVLWISYNAKKISKQLPIVETSLLEVGELVNSVNVDGVVESESTKKIFTPLTLPVDKNLVEVGDVVKEGDVLCELDPRTLEEQIKVQKSSAGAQSAITSNSVALAKKQLDQAQKNLSGDMNGQIAQAEQAIVAAEEQLNMAEVSYDGAVNSLQTYRRANREDGVYTEGPDASLAQYENARDNAYASYESAKANLRSAKENLEVTKNTVAQQIDSYNDSIKTNQITGGTVNSQWVTIENLEGDLERAVITAPINGVVTAVYVTEGATATGLLYVVEDLSDLKITANLKEYDLFFVKEKNLVTIKSDATGEEKYEGTVKKIAPTTNKTATGDNQMTTGEFETVITVTSANPDLKVGTKARVDIIYDQKSNVITVPFEAITTNKDGKEVVFVLEKQEDITYLVKEIPVTVGMEGDFSIEVSGEGLSAGSLIVKNALAKVNGIEPVSDGMQVHITEDLTTLVERGHLGATIMSMGG